VTTIPANTPVSLPALRGRAAAAFARGMRTVAARVGSAARRAGGTVLGSAGLVLIAVSVGVQFGWAWGGMLGGGFAVWVASLLPGD
jgi:hypothetical protein